MIFGSGLRKEHRAQTHTPHERTKGNTDAIKVGDFRASGFEDLKPPPPAPPKPSEALHPAGRLRPAPNHGPRPTWQSTDLC